MVNPPYDDDAPGLDAFDFGAPHLEDDGGSGLDAFDVYAPSADTGDATEPVFTVTNPPGTVTVSALFDGRVQRIELSPQATEVAEDQLAAEIVVIAGLATQRARAAQFSYMLDGVDTRDFLSRSVGLPSPEDADAAQAEVFATRYQGDHD